jgi:hypothetical protein
MRVRLLQLIGRAVDDELADLLLGCLPFHVLGERWAFVGLGDRAEVEIHRRGIDRRFARRTDRLVEGRLEARFESHPKRDQRGVPLPPRIDAVEAPVGELVAGIQRQLEILVDERRRAVDRHRIELSWVAGEPVQQKLADRPARLGELRHAR